MLVACVVAAVANRARIVQIVAAKAPPPPPPQVITRYVPVPTHAGHPLLSGWALVAVVGILGVVALGVTSLVLTWLRSRP